MSKTFDFRPTLSLQTPKKAWPESHDLHLNFRTTFNIFETPEAKHAKSRTHIDHDLSNWKS